MKYILLSYLIVGGIISAFGDIFLKKWAIEEKFMYYIIGLFMYLVWVVFFSLTLKEKNLWVANTVLETTNIVAIVLISYFYFQEKLSIPQLIGIWFCIFGVVLLEWGS